MHWDRQKSNISIIVPIYKVEDYLHRCVDSLLAQSYEDFELSLMDDGSPDNCGTICDQYVAQDARIRVIHKPNGGLSDAEMPIWRLHRASILLLSIVTTGVLRIFSNIF